MSITDKYNNLVDSSKKKELEYEKALESLRFYEECGLGKAEDLYRSQERIKNSPYPEYVQEVVNEAVKLIHDDKWKKRILNTPKMI